MDDSAARDFYQAGVSAYAAGRYDVALTAFTQGHELSGRPAFLFNIASSLDRLHRGPEALLMYRRYETAMPDSDNQAFVDRRVAFLTHEAEAREAAETARTEAGETQRAEQSRLAEEARTAESAAREQAREAEAAAANSRETSSPFLSAPAIAGYAVAGAGLVTLTVAGLISNGQYADLEASCSPGCSDDDLSTVRTTSLIADIGLGLAVAGVAFAVIYALVADTSDAPDASVQVGATASGANLS